MFIGLNETVRGASHVDSGTVCQDYSAFKTTDNYAVAAVADGHGSKKHFRSDFGSKAGVDVAIKAIDEFCSDSEEFEKKFGEDPDYIITKIQKYIIKNWYDVVNEHYRNNPVKQEEREKLTDEELSAIKIESIYGSTLLVSVLTKTFSFGMQLGDGSLVVIKQCGEAYMPIVDDESCPANLTSSLCNSNAIKMFNYFYSYERPLAIILSTDGLYTSFSSRESFEEYNCLLASQLTDIDVLKERMNKNFVRRTNSGSRDDISIAIIFEKEMFDDNLINVQMQVDINKNKAAIREAEEKAKQLQRRARAEQIRNEKKLIEEAQKASLAKKAKLKEAQGIESIELPSESEMENMK
ncbi:MAG: protein phosphatase 2C domain-containing protein [Ruminococcus sp.]|nr:protein phosphatase 2C domain-containing protein [Ruminococcus sp.]